MPRRKTGNGRDPNGSPPGAVLALVGGRAPRTRSTRHRSDWAAMDDVREAILTAIRAGNRLSDAAAMAGVSPFTANEWVKRGEGKDHRPATPLYRKFAEDVKKARAAAKVRAVTMVFSAGATEWKAAVAWLNWMYPTEFGPNSPTPDESATPVPQIGHADNVILFSPGDLERLGIAALRRVGPPEESNGHRPLSDLMVESDDPDEPSA